MPGGAPEIVVALSDIAGPVAVSIRLKSGI